MSSTRSTIIGSGSLCSALSIYFAGDFVNRFLMCFSIHLETIKDHFREGLSSITTVMMTMDFILVRVERLVNKAIGQWVV